MRRLGDNVHSRFLGFAGVLVELRQLVYELLQLDRRYMPFQLGDETVTESDLTREPAAASFLCSATQNTGLASFVWW